MKIYAASSWKNLLYPGIVHALKRCGHEVYDFRNPPGRAGFGWDQIGADWRTWSVAEYRAALDHPIAVAGYRSDIGALRASEAVVYVLPCGRSASWELGYAMGQGKRGYVVAFEPVEPDLMFREATIVSNMPEFFDAFGEPIQGPRFGKEPIE